MSECLYSQESNAALMIERKSPMDGMTLAVRGAREERLGRWGTPKGGRGEHSRTRCKNPVHSLSQDERDDPDEHDNGDP